MNGLFIVIEGINGAGKSVQAKRLAERLAREWANKGSLGNVLLTSEPWTSKAGMLLRTMLASGEPLPSAAELALLFACDRLSHCNEIIGPALAEGRTVICDRYYHSSLAYQGPWAKGGYGTTDRGMGGTTLGDGCAWVSSLNIWALCPDLTIVCGVSPERAMQRMAHRTAADAFDSDMERARLASSVYTRHLPKILRGDNIIVADASGTEAEVHDLIYGLVQQHVEDDEESR